MCAVVACVVWLHVRYGFMCGMLACAVVTQLHSLVFLQRCTVCRIHFKLSNKDFGGLWDLTRATVGRSGPYFRVLFIYMGEQNPKVWVRSAHGKVFKNSQNHQI